MAGSCAADGVGAVDVLRAHVVQDACGAVWESGVAPLASDEPGGVVDRAGSFGVCASGDVDHVVEVVVFSKAGSQEYAPHVDVVGDVAAVELADRYPEVTVEDFDGHGGLLLADAGEEVQALLQ